MNTIVINNKQDIERFVNLLPKMVASGIRFFVDCAEELYGELEQALKEFRSQYKINVNINVEKCNKADLAKNATLGGIAGMLFGLFASFHPVLLPYRIYGILGGGVGGVIFGVGYTCVEISIVPRN